MNHAQHIRIEGRAVTLDGKPLALSYINWSAHSGPPGTITFWCQGEWVAGSQRPQIDAHRYTYDRLEVIA